MGTRLRTKKTVKTKIKRPARAQLPSRNRDREASSGDAEFAAALQKIVSFADEFGLSKESVIAFMLSHSLKENIYRGLMALQPKSPEASAFNPLFLHVSVGLGKTHLMNVANAHSGRGDPRPRGETYSGSPEAKRGGGGIIAYLERVWAPFIKSGLATRRVIATFDASALTAIKNYTRTNPATGERRELPFHLLTLKEENDRKLAEVAPDALRLAVNRAKRGRSVQ